MRHLVQAALQRNREIAEKAGQWDRVERIDARLGRLAGPGRSEEEPEPEPEAAPAPPNVEDYAIGGGWYLIEGVKVQGRTAALELLGGVDEE